MSKSARNRQIRRPLKGAAGFTLLEMLVVLVLVSLASTLLFQGFGYVVSMRSRLSGHLQQVNKEQLQRHWFTLVATGLTASHSGDKAVFHGTSQEFQGLSLTSLASAPGVPTPFSWRLEQQQGKSRLLYREQQQPTPWEVANWSGIELSFRYLDRRGNWHDRWPPTNGVPVTQLPKALTLESSASDALPWLAVPGGRIDPRPDLRDLL